MTKLLDFIEKWPISLGLVIVVLAIPLALRQQKGPSITPTTVGVPKEPSAALFLSPLQKKVTLGQTFAVAILLSNQNAKIDGVDAILNYDPEMLRVLTLEKSELFEEYVQEKVDEEKGQICLSGLTFDPQEKEGTFGRIIFETLKEGETAVFFDFTPGLTKDSNVALTESTGVDVLKEVGSGRYVIE